MATHLKSFELHRAALNETLFSVELLICYNKPDEKEKWHSQEGCLGYPAAILLLSFIDSIGNLFDEIKTHPYRILKGKYFQNQKIDDKIIDDFYDSYRNKLIHNHSLPSNRYIEPNSESNIWYKTSKKSLEENVISKIYLKPLLNLCKHAFVLLENEHQSHFFVSNNIKDVKYKDIKLDSNNTNFPHSSGHIEFANPLAKVQKYTI